MDKRNTRLHLIRHGETDWNREGRWQGQIDIPLNQQGLEQARRTAAALEGTPIDAIYSSNLLRAMQTAEILAASRGLPMRLDARLREIHQGEWQGLRVSEIEARHASLYEQRSSNPYAFAPPGGESTAEVQVRVLSFLAETSQKHPGEAVAVVSHGFVLAVIRAAYQAQAAENLFSLVPQNGEIITIDLAG